MKSWRSWWTALSVAVLVQVSCGGESDEQGGPKAGSSAGDEVDAGKGGGSPTAGRGGKGGAGKGGTGGSVSTAGEGGEGAVSAVGGRSISTGGSSPTAGSGNSGIGGNSIAGTSSTSGTGGTGGGVPFNWHCAFALWGDGQCDCGCGVFDADCDENDLEECDTCNSPGSCNGPECPGRINPENIAACTPAPDEWSCPDYAYWDDTYCDCGCGVRDPDCEDEKGSSCEKCNLVGSCSGSPVCPGSISADDNTRCDIPEGWDCSPLDYLDSTCDCGCGIVDADCPSASVSVCENCWDGCAQWTCPGPIDAENNAICTGVPVSWSCDERFYDDGSLCHCGCGALDPDCETEGRDSCDRCNFEGSCSVQACPGTINPDDNRYCIQPVPPAEWTCAAYAYADGNRCDCGCGALDLDCRENDIELCETCQGCGYFYCPGRVDREDVTKCIEVPSSWHCYEYLYGDGTCTCGCGALDPDCADATVAACGHCPAYSGSCSVEGCSEINPEDNTRCNDSAPSSWTCDPDWYGDGSACDCGCGARDLDCSSASKSVCDVCLGESCSPPGCAAIDPEDNAICVAG